MVLKQDMVANARNAGTTRRGPGRSGAGRLGLCEDFWGLGIDIQVSELLDVCLYICLNTKGIQILVRSVCLHIGIIILG